MNSSSISRYELTTKVIPTAFKHCQTFFWIFTPVCFLTISSNCSLHHVEYFLKLNWDFKIFCTSSIKMPTISKIIFSLSEWLSLYPKRVAIVWRDISKHKWSYEKKKRYSLTIPLQLLTSVLSLFFMQGINHQLWNLQCCFKLQTWLPSGVCFKG